MKKPFYFLNVQLHLNISFSPTSIAGKRSNELLQSGLSSLKSAATSIGKKFDEMKEVISANSTPVKGAFGNATSALNSLMGEEDSTDGSSEINPDGYYFFFNIKYPIQYTHLQKPRID